LADLALVHTTRTTQQLVKFGSPADLPLYLPDLTLKGFSIWHVLQTNVQATPHANLTSLRLSIAAEYDRLVGEYVHKPAAHSAAASKLPQRKMKFKLN
jgi:hypothetical protein